MPASSACKVFLVDIFKTVGLLAERPLRFPDLGPDIGEALLIPLTLSRRVSELTGIPLGALTEAVYRLGQGRGLAGDLPVRLAEEYGWSCVDLTRLGATLRELDRDGTTAQIWQQLCDRWPIVGACYHELFPGASEATEPLTAPVGAKEKDLGLRDPEVSAEAPLVAAARSTMAVRQAVEQSSSSLISAKDLANKLRNEGRSDASDDAVGARLRRYRGDFPDCYREVEGRRVNEPKYLYRQADVLPHLREHFRVDGRATDGE
jgi:hypothetical protein